MANILHQLEKEEDDANLAHLRSEVERLRLTDAEREAITEASEFYIGTRTGVALRGLLERMQ